MSREKIADFLGDFSVTEGPSQPMSRGAVTIWLPVEAKSRFDRLQDKSGRQFGKKIREIVLAAIEQAEKLAS